MATEIYPVERSTGSYHKIQDVPSRQQGPGFYHQLSQKSQCYQHTTRVLFLQIKIWNLLERDQMVCRKGRKHVHSCFEGIAQMFLNSNIMYMEFYSKMVKTALSVLGKLANYFFVLSSVKDFWYFPWLTLQAPSITDCLFMKLFFSF